MIIEGDANLDGPRALAWELLFDPELLHVLIPGYQELVQISEGSYRGNIHVGVPAVTGFYEVRVNITDLEKKPELSINEFRRWALEEHLPLGRQLPGIRHYRMSVVHEKTPDMPYHTVSEFWFDDNEARLAAFGTPQGKAAAEDATAHCAERFHLLTEERVIIE